MEFQPASISTILLFLFLIGLSTVSAGVPRDIYNDYFPTSPSFGVRGPYGGGFLNHIRGMFYPKPLDDQDTAGSVTIYYDVGDSSPINKTDTDLDDDCLAYWNRLAQLFGHSINGSRDPANHGDMAQACRLLKNLGVGLKDSGVTVQSDTSSPNSNGTSSRGHGDDDDDDSPTDSGRTVKETSFDILQDIKDMVGGRQHDGHGAGRNSLFLDKIQDLIKRKLGISPNDD